MKRMLDTGNEISKKNRQAYFRLFHAIHDIKFLKFLSFFLFPTWNHLVSNKYKYD